MTDKTTDTSTKEPSATSTWAKKATWITLITSVSLSVVAAIYLISLIVKLIVEVWIAISHL